MVVKRVRTKFGNRKTQVDGIVFDSKREAEVYMDLLLRERAGKISDLKRQSKFLLIPSMKIQGRTQREISYVADFEFVEHGLRVVMDVKGFRTREYAIKRRLMKMVHNIDVVEQR